jgi:hypothetical protein
MVYRLPSSSGKQDPSKVRDHEHEMAGRRSDYGRKIAVKGGLQDPQQGNVDELFDVPQINQ